MDRPNIPLVAGLVGLVWAGGGQLYNRQPLKAVVFFVGFWGMFAFLGPIAFIVTLVSAVEAVIVSLADNAEE